MLWNRRWPASFRLDVGRADYLTPFLGFVGDQFAKVGWRAGDHRAAEVGKPQLQLRISQPSVDLIVQLGDDFCRCVLGRADTLPCAGLVPWQQISHRGDIW